MNGLESGWTAGKVAERVCISASMLITVITVIELYTLQYVFLITF